MTKPGNKKESAIELIKPAKASSTTKVLSAAKVVFLLSAAFLSMLAMLPAVYAHCPLCTVGAAVAATGAARLGVNYSVMGLFIGAFAVSIGFWLAKLIKKRFVPYQKPLLVSLSFLLTVIPIYPLFSHSKSLPLPIFITGAYGSMLNRTYILNLFLAGSLLGGLLVAISPFLSERLTRLRNGRKFPFQVMGLTFALLLAAGLVLQFILKV